MSSAKSNDAKTIRGAAPSSWREATNRLLASGGKEGLTLSNWLTLARILMVPVLVLFLLQGSAPAHRIAAVVFVLASLTDWLDGHLARTRGQITPLGEILDPIADKLLVIAALLPLVALGQVDAWLVGIIIGREFFVTTLRAVALKWGVVIAAGALGKLKMFVEVAAIILLILDFLAPVGTVLIWTAMILAVVSAVDYFRQFLRDLL